MKTAHTGTQQDSQPLDLASIRKDFPILERRIGGHPLVYLDNAATSQTPRVVIDRLRRYYEMENANIHRGVHTLSQEATNEYEKARLRAQRFTHAARVEEIIFTRGTTESINLVAQTFGRTHVEAGDEILISTVEHHSNIVPWQLLCQERGAKLRVVPMGDDGSFLFDEYEKLLSPRTKLVAISHVSNALGTIHPLHKIIERAHERDIPVLVDGAQAAPHVSIDVQKLDCDFYCFSAHKMYGPTGVGVLYGRRELLDAMPPWQGGGEMIRSVTFEKTEYNELPHKFEAGTPNIAGGIAFGAAIEYVETVGLERIAAHEEELLAYGTAALSAMPRIRLVGTADEKAGVISFVIDDIHPHDIGTILDQYGIAIRTGHHCAQPVMDRLGIPATARASFAVYNTREEIDALLQGLERVFEVFG
jgi:cysteine desulfurase/selenocysteine lyase